MINKLFHQGNKNRDTDHILEHAQIQDYYFQRGGGGEKMLKTQVTAERHRSHSRAGADSGLLFSAGVGHEKMLKTQVTAV